MPPPGWYPAPDGGRRWWDGAQFSDHEAPPAPTLPDPPTPKPPPPVPFGLGPMPDPPPKYQAPWRGILIVLGIIVGLVVLGELAGSDGGGDSSSDKKNAAFEICKEFVTDRLKAPGSATFRNYYQDDGEVQVSGSGDGPYEVVSSVDSENSFGASLRIGFTCTVTNTGGDHWRLDDLQVEE